MDQTNLAIAYVKTCYLLVLPNFGLTSESLGDTALKKIALTVIGREEGDEIFINNRLHKVNNKGAIVGAD